MTSLWLTVIVFTSLGLLGIVGAARTYFRRSPSPREFGTLFFSGWMGAAQLLMGTVGLVSALLTGLDFNFPAIMGVIVFVTLASAWPASWLATRWYQRASSHPDFAEDQTGNPIRAVAPAAEQDENIETWEDLVRAQRRRRGSAV
jgi:hypothetical protein